MSNELMPCPWCNYEVKIHSEGVKNPKHRIYHPIVHGKQCYFDELLDKVSSYGFKDKDQLIMLWNTRGGIKNEMLPVS